MQLDITAEQPPPLCPTGNAQTREMMKQGAKDLPALPQKLGIEIITIRVYGGGRVVLALVEASDIEKVREFIMQSRLIQWNTVKINATWSMEEALAKADQLPAIF